MSVLSHRSPAERDIVKAYVNGVRQILIRFWVACYAQGTQIVRSNIRYQDPVIRQIKVRDEAFIVSLQVDLISAGRGIVLGLGNFIVEYRKPLVDAELPVVDIIAELDAVKVSGKKEYKDYREHETDDLKERPGLSLASDFYDL